MKQTSARNDKAFTLVEMLVVVVVMVVLAGFLLPALAKARAKAHRISCISNLKQMGLAFRIFATDHGDRFPMQVWTNAAELTASEAFPLRYFVGMSNELSVPYVLVCPSDTRRSATHWTNVTRSNLSYFVGLEAMETFPQMLLAGDRNLTDRGQPVGPGLFPITTNTVLGWTDAMHREAGNLLLADGSAQQASSRRIQEQAQGQGAATNWLAMP